MAISEVTIKGIADGLVLDPGSAGWQAFLESLTKRLAETEPFFQGGQVMLQAGSRVLTVAQLQALTGLLEEHGLVLVAVDTTEPETRQAADTLGMKVAISNFQSPTSNFQLPTSNLEVTSSGVLLRRTLRSGQAVHHDGHVVIMGDVNPGAEVVASGDVLVWGRLRGLVHAGASGDETARVCALQLNPTQLRIGEHIARPPEENRRRSVIPEVARVVNGQIVVEAWQ
jgi:septum site-determining protein MinC